jgi:hypothetical protein
VHSPLSVAVGYIWLAVNQVYDEYFNKQGAKLSLMPLAFHAASFQKRRTLKVSYCCCNKLTKIWLKGTDIYHLLVVEVRV